MKKNLSLVLVLVLLNSCAESLALLGPLSTIGTGGKIAQSAVSSGVSYGVMVARGSSR
jgi:hypothetical protein